MQSDFGTRPYSTKCPYCTTNMTTEVEFKNTLVSYLLALLTLLLTGFMVSFIFIPVVMVLTKQLIHRCSVCNQEIGNDGKLFHALGLSDGVISFKINEVGMILTRKILISIIIALITVGIFLFKIHQIQTDPNFNPFEEKIFKSNKSWESYLQQCAHDKMFTIDHMGKCRSLINYTYSWTGNVIRVEDYQNSLYRFMYYSGVIYVQMDPHEKEHIPDLLLSIDTTTLHKYQSVIESLNRGDEIHFSAILKTNGDSSSIRHFHLVEITKGTNHKEIGSLLHRYGRYNDRNFFTVGEDEK